MTVRLSITGEEIDESRLSERIDRIDVRGSKPFSAEALRFLNDLSKRLLQHPRARNYPEIQALGFWIRPASIHRLHRDFKALTDTSSILVPRGLAFHIPPANVDTIFVYSWVMSMLVGNANLIRLPSHITPPLELLLSVVAESLKNLPTNTALRRSVEFVSYGHDPSITATISSRCDVRVIWGGDDTVNTVRAVPLPPRAVELVFPDRYSYCVINAITYNSLGDREQNTLAENFFNDAYWFDQTGCASPRIVCWSGSEDACIRASEVFWAWLRDIIQRRSYTTELGQSLNKLEFSYGSALQSNVESITRYLGELDVVRVADITGIHREHCGGGLFYEVFMAGLSDLCGFVEIKDQTVTHFGFSSEDITAFAEELNGSGVDRFVPIGKALEFNRYWDGYDLLQVFSKRVTLQ